MGMDTAGQGSGSTTPTWEASEGFVREKAQELIQQILEQEVTELLGRAKSERKAVVHSPEGYRNGHGKPRHLVTSIGTITVRRLREGWTQDFEAWGRRSLKDREVVYAPRPTPRGSAEGPRGVQEALRSPVP